MSNNDEKWEAIVAETIEEAELVKCSPSEFVQGLKHIEIQIRDRRLAAEEEYGIGGDDDDEFEDDELDEDELE